jgi:hypothetical protein
MKDIWLGGMIFGVMDISAAFITAAILSGAAPVRILWFIARGLLGPTMQNNFWTAALGLALHFLIAFTATAVYWAASRQLPILTKQAVPFGMLYGVMVFFFMYFGVRPLSYLGTPHLTTQSAIIAVLTHITCVGLPIALSVRKWQ